MAHPLRGAQLKVIRAQEHCDALKTVISDYLNERRYSVISQDQPNGTVETTITINSQPPDDWSAVVGDCVTNCRAALDYIAWEIARKYFVSPALDPLNRDDRKLVSFPISDVPYSRGGRDAYCNKINCFANRGVHTSILDEIKAAQPHHAGNGVLKWLRELVNADKHRALLLTSGQLSNISVAFSAPATISSQQFSGQGLTSFTASNLKTNTITMLTSNVGMNVQPTVVVALQDVSMPSEPIETLLDDIVKCVAIVVARFERFFV